MVVSLYEKYNDRWVLKRWAFAGPRSAELRKDYGFNLLLRAGYLERLPFGGWKPTSLGLEVFQTGTVIYPEWWGDRKRFK